MNDNIDMPREFKAVPDRVAAVAKFIICFVLFIAGVVLIGAGAGMAEKGYHWLVLGVAVVSVAFFIPLNPRNR